MNDFQRLSALLDHAQDKLVVVDASGTCAYANAAVERLLGYGTDEYRGTTVFEYIHPDDRSEVETAFNRLVDADDERSETAEYRHRAADGSWVWLESQMSNRLDAELDGYVVSSRDITERKRAEERHRETEIRLRQLAAHTDDVLWMVSDDWTEALFVNEAFEALWGIETKTLEADPKRFLDGIHPDDRERASAAMKQLSAGEAIDAEYRVNPSKAYRRWAWVQASPIFEDGEVTRIVGFARDVTDRRRRERQLQVMDNLLRHNLRNDMNIILGHAELVRESDNPPIEECMQAIVETGEDLLETAEKEREIVEILVGLGGRERLDIAAIVRNAIEDVRSGPIPIDISVSGPESADVLALPEISRAVFELLYNAVEHAENTPEIEVTLRPHGDVVELTVSDNAPPIPANEFEPLFEGNAPDAVYHGTGLGLWLVYWVVDLSEGAIDFDCSKEGGNTITVTLPRAEPATNPR